VLREPRTLNCSRNPTWSRQCRIAARADRRLQSNAQAHTALSPTSARNLIGVCGMEYRFRWRLCRWSGQKGSDSAAAHHLHRSAGAEAAGLTPVHADRLPSPCGALDPEPAGLRPLSLPALAAGTRGRLAEMAQGPFSQSEDGICRTPTDLDAPPSAATTCTCQGEVLYWEWQLNTLRGTTQALGSRASKHGYLSGVRSLWRGIGVLFDHRPGPDPCFTGKPLSDTFSTESITLRGVGCHEH
jgi:hypothetical protein